MTKHDNTHTVVKGALLLNGKWHHLCINCNKYDNPPNYAFTFSLRDLEKELELPSEPTRSM